MGNYSPQRTADTAARDGAAVEQSGSIRAALRGAEIGRAAPRTASLGSGAERSRSVLPDIRASHAVADNGRLYALVNYGQRVHRGDAQYARPAADNDTDVSHVPLLPDCAGGVHVDKHGDENAEWLALPCEDEEIYELEFQFNMGLDMLECYRFESALPTLQVFDLYGKDELFALNALAKNLLELDTTAFLKYKAILKVENLSSFTDAAESLEQMDEYDFSIVADEADFAREYLIAVLPEGFDQTPLYEADMHDFGRAILASKGARMTGYGAVLKNGDLYSPVMDESMRGQISTQCAEPTNEMIGGMSL